MLQNTNKATKAPEELEGSRARVAFSFRGVKMHIPDGFLNPGVCGVTYGLSAVAVGLSLRRLRGELEERIVPLMGVMAAFVFSAQMLNFPIAGGTSGHFLGAALLAILLGPWAGILAMTAVLVVQALVFQDGGITALGANVLNMAVVGVLSAYGLYMVFRRLLRPLAAFLAGWASVILAAIFCSFELSISGTSPLVVTLPAMAGVHALIGTIEGLITMTAVAFVRAVRPDLIAMRKV